MTEWVAFLDGSEVDKPTYLRRNDGLVVSWTFDPADAQKFPTKKAALAALRAVRPGRVRGVTHNAEQVTR